MYRNLIEALVGSLRTLQTEGAVVPSRNGETKELYCHQVRISNPTERFLVTPARGASPFAQLAEAIWVLGGRNDVEFLSRYLPRAGDYSDDGKVWRGGYGPRLRAWGATSSVKRTSTGIFGVATMGVDQFAKCYEILKAKLDSRQAVMVIFDPASDYVASKDIPCLAGETPLWSPEGDLPIEDVAEKFSTGEVVRWPVYAVDPATREQKLTWATNVWKSGEKRTIKLNFDDGSALRLTADHRIYLKRRMKREGAHPKATFTEIFECNAGDLRPGDRILATHRRYSPKGYELHKKILSRNTAFDNMQPVHRAYFELVNGPIPDGYDVHHVNEVKTDNRIVNLEAHPHDFHSSFNMFGDRNPMRRMSQEQHIQRSAKQARSLAANHAIRTQEQRASTVNKQRQATLHRHHADNHKVVSIEDGGVTPVYDFQVPEFHTALVGTGVVAHNCNNWLHFLVRDGKLNLTVGVRSNDVIWGFSGINVFEWSVFMEVMAYWLGVEVGTMGYTASSFHLYEYHYEKGSQIVKKARSKTLYDFGLPHIPFTTQFENFNEEMNRFFEAEEALSQGLETSVKPTDPFLLAVLHALEIHKMIKTSVDPREIAEAIMALPPSDMRAAILEFTRREPHMKAFPLVAWVADRLSVEERTFFEWYNNPPKAIGVSSVFSTLKVLHEKKTRSYGDSWRKHGEILGVFSNITRKWDRIGALAKGAQGLSDEGFLDTIADLCVYAGKYLTLLAELYPVAFADFLQRQVIEGQTFLCDSDSYTGLAGFERVLDMLPVAFENDQLPISQDDFLAELGDQYKRIEQILTNSTRRELGEIVIPAAAHICILSAHLICLLAKEDPHSWENYVTTVEKL